MLFGPEKVLACPRCGALERVFTLRSGNTLGAVSWTDGKMRAPMLPQPPVITRCQTCQRFYWLAQAAEVGRVEPDRARQESDAYPGEWLAAPQVRELGEDDLLAALEAGAAQDREQEVLLRRLAWWAANDPLRAPFPPYEPAADASLSPAALENLRSLYKLLEPAGAEERLMKAEAARELGRFSEALDWLEARWPQDYGQAAERIRALAADGDRTVRVLRAPER